MPVAVAVLVALGAVTALVMLLLVLRLVRHLRLLKESLRSLEEQLNPLLLEIQDGAERAQEQLEELSRQRLETDPGARLPE